MCLYKNGEWYMRHEADDLREPGVLWFLLHNTYIGGTRGSKSIEKENGIVRLLIAKAATNIFYAVQGVEHYRSRPLPERSASRLVDSKFNYLILVQDTDRKKKKKKRQNRRLRLSC